MPEYRVTFGSQYGDESSGADPHPRVGYLAHRDGWFSIIADTEQRARELTIALLGAAWSFIYGPDDRRTLGDWNDTFPRGELLRVIDPAARQPAALYVGQVLEVHHDREVLVTQWPNRSAELATRRLGSNETWGIPQQLEVRATS